jgi:hypothetical protein
MNYYKRDNCRYCGSKDIKKFIDLGLHPPSNSFIESDQIPVEKKFPLVVYLCNNCFLVQLLDVVSADNIFSHYFYLSSSSKALVNHFGEMTTSICNQYNVRPNDVVVDIGCNDGITLKTYPVNNLIKIGVEPSDVAKKAEEAGINVINKFFSKDVAEGIAKNYGRAKIITATNVFAHVDDMHSFVEGIHDLLVEDGLFIIEISYLLDLIDQNLFDTIYHEHLCYLSLTPVVSFLKKYDLEVFKVERYAVGASGPAIRIFIKRTDSPGVVDYSVQETLTEEANWGVSSLSHYYEFADRVKKVKADTINLIQNFKDKNIRIGGFGAPAKGNTLLNYYELKKEDITCIAENNQLKQGMLTPGSHIPIIGDEEFLEENFEYAMLLSWNYKEFFIENSEYIKRGGKFIIPLPAPHILPEE